MSDAGFGLLDWRQFLRLPMDLMMLRFFPLVWPACGVLLLVLIALALAVWFSQRILTVDSGEVKADALVVLGGGSAERPRLAAELFKAGAAPKILLSGRGDCESNAELLEKSGVPASAITREDRSTSTLENAKLGVPLLRQMGAHRVILVTTWYHSRRALVCFEHFAPDITFYSRPSYLAYRRKEWTRWLIGDCILAELVKLPGYWVCYGICPL